jgi:hypothetical protein
MEKKEEILGNLTFGNYSCRETREMANEEKVG